MNSVMAQASNPNIAGMIQQVERAGLLPSVHQKDALLIAIWRANLGSKHMGNAHDLQRAVFQLPQLQSSLLELKHLPEFVNGLCVPLSPCVSLQAVVPRQSSSVPSVLSASCC